MDFFIIKDLVLLCIGIALLIFFTLKKDKPRKVMPAVKPVISTKKEAMTQSEINQAVSQQGLKDLNDPLHITCPYNVVSPLNPLNPLNTMDD
ncbi:hypothetical protein EDF88_4551 [Buttiauxella sp. BIGb0552]|jgi:hypothetical protein|uniref:hypothetical protein n=1 Tax=Enterobacterales TaxID=91347 RepID=UPI0010668FF3|nr:hypothetical protein [Buttiauxella sp. BIGb0552]TDX11953.1 hypothetical protein EDF88_4551 [Buttiauxella sp. BIGb0552]